VLRAAKAARDVNEKNHQSRLQPAPLRAAAYASFARRQIAKHCVALAKLCEPERAAFATFALDDSRRLRRVRRRGDKTRRPARAVAKNRRGSAGIDLKYRRNYR
jgi:hypothetical protein